LQAGRAVSFFGYGLILLFEIIYLHQIRGFATATAGLVLAAILGTGTLVTPPTGALLDHFRPKPILIAGNDTTLAELAAAHTRRWQSIGQGGKFADPRRVSLVQRLMTSSIRLFFTTWQRTKARTRSPR